MMQKIVQPSVYLRVCQQGATLLVGMVILLLMTILTIAVFQMGKGNLQIVGNMQQRNEALSAA